LSAALPPAAYDDVDRDADICIGECLNLAKPRSFFLFAGAGSGKTRSLVKALEELTARSGGSLRLRGQRIAVITYTNAACDEILERLNFDPLVEVSTIHSFVWSLIKGLNTDIRRYLETSLKAEITELEGAQAKGRAGKAANDRARSIESKRVRLVALGTIKAFTYNPNGENRGRDSLNHSEVIKIAATFLTEKPLMQSILVSKFPILLIDESQDTNRLLMEAFLLLQTKNVGHFALGLFGDTMQRIYADGKADLGQNLPLDWAKPSKKMNHRCPKRVVKLINKIREATDGQQQQARDDRGEGTIRLFVLPANNVDKPAAENTVIEKMAAATNDPKWASGECKRLILEHHMAARRMKFSDMYEALSRSDRLRIGLLDGSLSGLRLFSKIVLPLVQAYRAGNQFGVAAIVRRESPLLNKVSLKAAGAEQAGQLARARVAVGALTALFVEGNNPRFLDVLRNIVQSSLFEIPDNLRAIATRTQDEQKLAEELIGVVPPDENGDESELAAWDTFLLTPFDQIERYSSYVSGEAEFDTQQGVKGLEFPRVMVVIDDEEARGFLFSYEKLFGVKEKTKTDTDNERDGKETGIDRTRRLFYVTCSRAEHSLALVCYSTEPQKVRNFVVSEGWFEADEVELVA
jgi:DNA helicase-2/ATP-dependent DNA helicase PcrA